MKRFSMSTSGNDSVIVQRYSKDEYHFTLGIGYDGYLAEMNADDIRELILKLRILAGEIEVN